MNPETPRRKRARSESPSVFRSPSHLKEGILDIEENVIEKLDSLKKMGASSYQRTFLSTSRSNSPITTSKTEQDLGLKSSAIRRGIINLSPQTGKISPLPNYSNRSTRSPDRKAIKKAMLVTYPILSPHDYDYLQMEEDDEKFAEKIIKESNSSKKKSNNNSPLYSRRLLDFSPRKFENDDPDFETVDGTPFNKTPLPSPIQEKQIVEKFGRNHKLLESSQTLFTDGPEGYFEQNKFKGKPSGNTMKNAPEVDYLEFNKLFKLTKFLYHNERNLIEKSYHEIIDQIKLEILNGFNICLYGIGSKIKLMDYYTNEVSNFLQIPVIVINGYNPASNIKELIEQLIEIVIPKVSKGKYLVPVLKIPKTPVEAIPILLNYLNNENSDNKLKVLIAINNIDGECFKNDKFQTMLAQLSSTKQISLICTIDKFNAPILWDSSKKSKFNFIWHNVTNYEPYFIENSFEDILNIGKSNNNVSSKGAKYVLDSLTSNQRKLYSILISNQMVSLEDEPSGTLGSVKNGIEFKILFNLCVTEFVASNEITFRTMLKEFIEHDMANIQRNEMGTEIVFVPLSMDELETLMMEHLMD